MATSDPNADFRAAADALNEAADKELRKQVYARLRKIAKPLGVKVIREGSARLPRAGGLSARVAAAKMSQSNSTTGRNPGVALRFRTSPTMDLQGMDEGIVRHPYWGHWVRGAKPQSIRPRAFSDPFEAGREPVAAEIVKAMEDVAKQIEHQSESGGR